MRGVSIDQKDENKPDVIEVLIWADDAFVSIRKNIDSMPVTNGP